MLARASRTRAAVTMRGGFGVFMVAMGGGVRAWQGPTRGRPQGARAQLGSGDGAAGVVDPVAFGWGEPTFGHTPSPSRSRAVGVQVSKARHDEHAIDFRVSSDWQQACGFGSNSIALRLGNAHQHGMRARMLVSACSILQEAPELRVVTHAASLPCCGASHREAGTWATVLKRLIHFDGR
jgi:hypothetical protein